MPFMTRIPSDLHRMGLKVELVPGWETRGTPSFAPAGVVDHWTAGPRGTRARPSLSVVVNGRAGLSGPLCNVYLARDGTCVVVAAGRANHAGAGGFRGLVGNSAVYGIEAESGGDGDWTPEMLDAYPRLDAALVSGLGRDASWVCGHNEWAPTRKIDIRDIIGQVRANTARVLAAPTPAPASEEDDMPQVISGFVPPKQQRVIPIPPVLSGGAGWGQAWLSLLVDRFGEPGAEVPVRVAVMGANGGYRPPGGTSMDMLLKPNQRYAWALTKNDHGLVITAADDTLGVGYMVEYAKP